MQNRSVFRYLFSVAAFAAFGAVGRAPVALAECAAPSGHIFGVVTLDNRDPSNRITLPAGASVRVNIAEVVNSSYRQIGVVELGPVTEGPDGVRRVRYSVSHLPLGVELRIWVELVQPPNASPAPSSEGLNLIHFRPKDPSLQLSEVYAVTLTGAHSSAEDRDFVPYLLEMPPMPEGVPAPTPSRT